MNLVQLSVIESDAGAAVGEVEGFDLSDFEVDDLAHHANIRAHADNGADAYPQGLREVHGGTGEGGGAVVF